jgi:hypothetical protein
MIYLGDIHLSYKFKPPTEYKWLIFTRCHRRLLETYEMLVEVLKDFELKTAKDATLITKTSERMNEISNIKFLTETLDHMQNELPAKALECWACFGVAHDLVNLVKNNKFVKTCEECMDLMDCSSRRKVKLNLGKNPLLQEFIQSLISQEQIDRTEVAADIHDRLLDYFETCMVCLYDQKRKKLREHDPKDSISYAFQRKPLVTFI